MVKRINTDGNYGKIMGKGGTYRGEYIEREIRIVEKGATLHRGGTIKVP